MDAIGKYLSPLTDLKIGFDVWNEGDEVPSFAAPLKIKKENDENKKIPDSEVNGIADDVAPAESSVFKPSEEENNNKGNEEIFVSLPEKSENPTGNVSYVAEPPVLPAVTPAADVDVRKEVSAEIVNPVNDVPEYQEKKSFLSTLKIISGAGVSGEENSDIVFTGQTDGAADAVSCGDNSLIAAHVIAPLLKTIGSLAYQYHLVMSPEDEEKELDILINDVKTLSGVIAETFRESGVSAIGLYPRFMYVSRPVVQQAYELYHSPMTPVYRKRIGTIIQSLARFVIQMFPQSRFTGELDAHDRLDMFEALSSVIVPLGQSEDENPERILKEVCRTLVQKAEEWGNSANTSGVYSDYMRMISRFSSLFADVYLSEVERFLHLEAREKHIYINTYNQAPALPVVWNLFDKKVCIIKKASDAANPSGNEKK